MPFDAAAMSADNRKVVWSAELSMGLYRLDEQHKNIISTFNKLLAEADAPVGSEIVSDTLAKLTRHACEHFRDEESLLERLAYPGIEEHRKEHQEFREKIVQCCVATTLGVRTVPKALLAYLQEWLDHHLLEQDMKYKQFLAAAKDG